MPTLVLHRTDVVVPIAGARWLAERIPDARFEELPGEDHLIWFGDQRSVVAAIEAFADELGL